MKFKIELVMTKLEIGKMLIDYKNDRTNYGSMLKAIEEYASTAKPNVDYSFACQRSVEGNSGCDIQCDHCKQYYSPLQKLNVSGELPSDEECKCIRYTGGDKWYSNGCKIHPNG